MEFAIWGAFYIEVFIWSSLCNGLYMEVAIWTCLLYEIPYMEVSMRGGSYME